MVRNNNRGVGIIIRGRLLEKLKIVAILFKHLYSFIFIQKSC